MALHLNKFDFPPPKALCQIWLKFDQWFLEEDESMKSLQKSLQRDRQTDGRTYDGQKAIRKAQASSSGELKYGNLIYYTKVVIFIKIETMSYFTTDIHLKNRVKA